MLGVHTFKGRKTMKSATFLDERRDADAETLLCEIQQYLDVIGTFRAEGCEPHFEDDEPLARLLSGCYPAT
jgi:hypothetical protein